VWEAVRLTLSQTYNLEPTPITATATTATGATTTVTTTPHRFSDLGADLIIEPLFGLHFRGTATINPYDQQITSATTDTSYETEIWRASFGTRHQESGRLQFIQGDAQARIGTRWLVHFASNYDIQSGTVIENRLEVSFREQCWAISAAFIERSTGNEFNITINLLELGQYGFGRAFASLP
jgi:lipopolysaccharide assembly outer membrane protein LptD (OstA)